MIATLHEPRAVQDRDRPHPSIVHKAYHRCSISTRARPKEAPLRICWQSFVDPSQQAVYVDDLRTYLNSIADPGVSYDVVGLSPAGSKIHRLTEMRCATQVVGNAVVADRDGFDAFVIGHFQDSGLFEARSAIGIPVIGMGEATMLHACTLGRTIGLVTIDPQFISWHEEQVTRYGLRDRIVTVRALSMSVADFMAAFSDPVARQDALARFEGEALPLVEAGVEVIVPAGGLPALLFRDQKNFTIRGAIVLNSIAVTAKQSEVAAKLRRLDGTSTSRAGTFVRPSDEALREFLDLTADARA